jgi:predicted DCC family thiol-disulfide oxidoreductase YuxK
MNYHLPLILFDPECPLCLRFKQGLEFLDKNLNFVSAREEAVYLAFPELQRQECLATVHMITAGKEILRGPEVVEYLVKVLPGVSKLAWLLDSEQGRKVSEYFYQKVEELREIVKKKEEGCGECPHES